MCRPLTVNCLRRVGGIDVCDHFLTFYDLKISCKTPGTPECEDGTAELVPFQNAPTMCAGRAKGLRLDPEERGQRCKEALEKYGRELHRFNVKGSAKPTWWEWVTGKEKGQAASFQTTQADEDSEEA